MSEGRDLSRPAPTIPALAVVAFVLGVLGSLGLLCGGGLGAMLLGVPAIVSGVVAWRRLGPGKASTTARILAGVGAGLGATELLLGLAFFVVWVLALRTETWGPAVLPSGVPRR